MCLGRDSIDQYATYGLGNASQERKSQSLKDAIHGLGDVSRGKKVSTPSKDVQDEHQKSFWYQFFAPRAIV